MSSEQEKKITATDKNKVIESIVKLLCQNNGVGEIDDTKFFLDYNGEGRVELYTSKNGKIGEIKLPSYLYNVLRARYDFEYALKGRLVRK